jgi:chemotaxis methyl-accepting protein methylase
MIKFGICTLKQLRAHNPESFLGSRKFVSVLLYEQLAEMDSPDRDRLMEYVLLNFSGSNGAFMRTYANRFGDFDNEVAKLARALPVADGALKVHDIAVSDGRTACDFYEALESVPGARVDFLASDFCPPLRVVVRCGRPQAVVMNAGGEILQMVCPPFVFNTPRHERWLFPLNHFFLWWFARSCARPLLRRLKSGDPAVYARELRLICPRCRRLLKERDNFKFCQYSLFDPMPGSFDLARAMNVLNKSYFTDDQIRQAVRNVRDGLREGGLFVSGRNDTPDSPLRASVYRRNGARFERVHARNGGSPIDDLVFSI